MFLKNVLNIGVNCKMTEQELIILLADVEGAGVSSTRFGNQPMFWKSAKGCNVYSLNGDKYLDCTSSYGVMGIGYSHPDINKAITETMNNISHTMCEIYPTVPYVQAIDKIRKVIGRPNDQVILTSSGSDAVDVALKLGYRYTGKKGVIAFENSFHGQTLNSLNVTGQKQFRDPFTPILPNNVFFRPFPNSYRNPFRTEEELIIQSVDLIEKVILGVLNTDDEIGVLLVEPMQNAAGYIIPPKGFLSEIRKLCNKYEILMVDDEIFTGFGRCGRWLMADYEEVYPDIVCVGKVMTGGVPAAACVATKTIMKSLDYSGMVPLHGSTFTGNAIICSAISSTIDVIVKNQLIEKSEVNGQYLRENLRDVLRDIRCIGDIRGYGSATMIEFVENHKNKVRNPAAALRFSNYLLNKHIISLISGLPYGNCVALCTPFIMNKCEIDMVLSVCQDFAKEIDDI